MTENTPESTLVLYSDLSPLERLKRRRDAFIAAARAIPVAVLDTEDDPVLCDTKRQLLEAAGRLFLTIQHMERNRNV